MANHARVTEEFIRRFMHEIPYNRGINRKSMVMRGLESNPLHRLIARLDKAGLIERNRFNNMYLKAGAELNVGELIDTRSPTLKVVLKLD